MKAVSVKVISDPPDGPRIVDATIVADETPDPLPVNGSGIIGLKDTDLFAPFCLLYVVGEADNKVFITGEDGHFVPQ